MIPSTSAAAANMSAFAAPRHLLQDHVRRVNVARNGFQLIGRKWLEPFLCYALSPVLKRALTRQKLHFDGFDVRLGEEDLYTFANLFEDYPVGDIGDAIADVEAVVDLGANVGAFSWLADALCAQRGLSREIVAVEPSSSNVEFLRQQPFARRVQIHHAAVGAEDGTATLVTGRNSVTHHVDFTGESDGVAIPVLSLRSLCQRPALVKMDIEGGEHSILAAELPDNVRHLFLEWHTPPGSNLPPSPASVVPGDWRRVSTDGLNGSTMWHWRR